MPPASFFRPRFPGGIFLGWLFLASSLCAASPEALLIIVGDQHSAYDRLSQFVARVDALKAQHPGVPLAVLLNGDSLEYGNAVARRTNGAIDFAVYRALAARAPTVLNLGNHEPEFYDVAETVARISATGVRVISGNLRDAATKRPYAPATTTLKLGAHELTVVGVTTDRLSTYRAALRPQLDPADPAVWARENFPALAKASPRLVVLSHAGLRADRAMFEFLAAGTLFAGAHDHLQFVHRAPGGPVYFHSGSWMEVTSIARLQRDAQGTLRWEIEQPPLRADDPADPAIARLVRETLAQQLTPEETAVVGRLPRSVADRGLAPGDAAKLAVESARLAANADVAVIGATTFGAGLPAGDVNRYAFDACVRFDGTLFTGEISGVELKKLLARANQGPDTPFAARAGENLIVSGPDALQESRTYRLVTTDWIAKNAKTYLGENPPVLVEHPKLKLKAAVLERLNAVSAEGERKAR